MKKKKWTKNCGIHTKIGDIRQIWINAMRYNPDHHVIHQNAFKLLGVFEDGFAKVLQRSGASMFTQKIFEFCFVLLF